MAAVLISILSTLLVVLLGGLFSGQLVPVSRAQRSEELVRTLQATNTKLEETNRQQFELILQMRTSVQISEEVAKAVKVAANSHISGGVS